MSGSSSIKKATNVATLGLSDDPIDSIGGGIKSFGSKLGDKGDAPSNPIQEAIAAQLQTNLFPGAEAFFNRGTKGIFQGNRLADQSATTGQAQQQSLDLAKLLQGQTSGFLEGFQPLLNTNVGDIESTFLDTVGAENERFSGLTQDLIDQFGAQAGQQFSRNILPAIGGGAQAAIKGSATNANIRQALLISVKNLFFFI